MHDERQAATYETCDYIISAAGGPCGGSTWQRPQSSIQAITAAGSSCPIMSRLAAPGGTIGYTFSSVSINA